MKFTSLSCMLLLVAATTYGVDDEWSWGIESKDSLDSSSVPVLDGSSSASSSSSSSSFSSSSFREGHSFPNGPSLLNIDTLPLDQDDSFVYEVLPLATEGESLSIISLPFESGPLPLEPHGAAGTDGTLSLSVVGEGELVDGLVIAEGGDREGRFLGLGDKLCSFGIGINCANKKYPAPGKPHYAPPKVGASQGIYSRPNPVKTHYAPPKPAVPQGTYGAPVSRPPPPPAYPNRNHNVPSPTQAPFSPLNGLLAVLKPFMPTSKPKTPPRLSHGGVLSPSYTAPNPNYAPLLPSYTPPIKATYPVPTPTYAAPPSAYSPPKPAYHVPKPAYSAPTPTYTTPNRNYNVVKPAYAAPKPSYAAPKPAFINPVPTITVHAKPTLVEQHHHTHTHVYNDKTVNEGIRKNVHNGELHTHVYNDDIIHAGIYKNDRNGVLESVHDSINTNQHVIHRQDISDTSHNIVQVAQPSVNHVVQQPSVNRVVQRPSVNHVVQQQSVNRVVQQQSVNHVVQQPSANHVFVQQQFPAASSAPSIVPAVLVGGANFRPGRIESGFQPMQSVLETLFRPQRPTYREDCQCVAASFCPSQDVIGRNAPADLSNVIDARTRGTEILSNATESDENTRSTESDANPRSARRGKQMNFPEEVTEAGIEAEEVTETATEAEEVTDTATEAEEVTDAATEGYEYEEGTTEAPTSEEENDSRKRRDTIATLEEEEEETEEEEEVPASAYSDRQGRQLNGFTPDGNGCGPNYVCCRRPVFKPRRQRYTCGRRNAAGLLGRVKTAHFVKGDTEFGAYPWQAAILKRENGDVLYQCGGTLIDDKHVLTAAHCVDGLHPSQVSIRLGEWDVTGQTEFYDHVEVRASGIYLHPEFYAGNLNNDIAIIRLEQFMDFSSNPHITPVCLPDKFTDFTHQRCHATGWGKDAFGSQGKFSQVLKEVEVPILDNQRCQQTLQSTRLGGSFSLHEGNFCAGGEEGRDTCKGDGGGPLVCPGPDGGMQLVGLVSWGIGCGNSGVPGVYVKVSHYLDWIGDITRV